MVLIKIISHVVFQSTLAGYCSHTKHVSSSPKMQRKDKVKLLRAHLVNKQMISSYKKMLCACFYSVMNLTSVIVCLLSQLTSNNGIF